MSPTVVLISAVASILVALIAAGGAVLVARQAKQAQDKTNEVQEESNDLQGFRDLASEYKAERDDVRTRLGGLEEKSREQDKALRMEQLKREGMARELDEERGRTTRLEARFRAAVTYIQSLVVLLRANDIPVPPPPDGFGIDPPR